ncbi:hypothetical protein CDD81_7197 [Ophiocordyceps australis]|uniref:Helicase ATP-binding domain-containing protein n=1 Tax=Ophiocordyceps australis TaxID=1399860 RepID=A0A2C5Y6A0_9HYPO|nr:hypothetical protein CDD81_7197 [Ophiocordyceps australis]
MAASSSDAESMPSSPRSSSAMHVPSSPATQTSTSSPCGQQDGGGDSALDDDFALEREEEAARVANAETRRRAAAQKRRRSSKKRPESKAERDKKARELDELLVKSAAFSDILTKKTQVLGRVGSLLDGRTLGEHDLQMARQPRCMVGGTMRDYQLEGLTWMYEICAQGMSGILADEMGLGKTVQTIALIALLREKEGYLGPHLIVAPLSTLSNWLDEFHKWTPAIPVVMYHGNQQQRDEIYKSRMARHLQSGRPTAKFPVVCTSYEMVLRDRHNLCKIQWEFIIIDEGHRMKNAEAKLFQELRQFHSATRLLITGTPLQNNLKELWSLLHFLLPNIFTDWDAFESWFDFSDLKDEDKTHEFIQDGIKQDLVKKMHLILQPLLLRRVKRDVAAHLPKKREYVLFAPMTREQTELYKALTDINVDARQFLEEKAVEQVLQLVEPKPLICAKPVKRGQQQQAKRKDASPHSRRMANKSAKSSRESTPASTRATRSRATSYRDVNTDEEDALSDDAFEARLADEVQAAKPAPVKDVRSLQEIELAEKLQLAKKQVAQKKLGNPLAQLRLACNSPHNFYNPWSLDLAPVSEALVRASGKMMLLDRLLTKLFATGHKVLLFSQFTTQLDLLDAYARLRGWPACRIDGSVPQAQRRQQIADFDAVPELKLFLLSTRAGGQGINLAAADSVILYDSDFNPQQDLQAQDRAHRIGQTRPVIVYRLATRGTVEEALLLSADAKRRLEKLVIRSVGPRRKTARATIKREPQDDDDDDGGGELDADALRELLARDGLEYATRPDGGLSDQDLDILCDRSDEAYERAAAGLGDAHGYRVVETGADAIKMAGGDAHKS